MRARLLGFVFALVAGVANAADLEPLPQQIEPPDGWTFQVKPYFWAVALDVSTRPTTNAPTTSASLKFNDILENLKFSGTLAASAHRGRFGVAGDVMYSVLRGSNETPGGVFSRARVTTKLFIGSAFADYKPIVDPRGELILSGGVRVYNSDTRLDLTAGRLPERTFSGSDFWADPMIGTRGTFKFTPKIFANGWAYVGGFGAGSELSADLFGGVGYNFNDHIAANVGYRFLHVDRDTASFKLDLQQYGPFAGLVISF